MKVICIDASPNKHGVEPPDLKEGDIYNKVSESVVPEGYVVYDLSGCEFQYGAFRFVPLSSIDETEMIREYNKELV